jgi:hypothetical protein
MHVASLFNRDGLSLLVDGKMFTVARDHINWDKIVESLKNRDYTDLLALIDVSSAVRDWIGDFDDLSIEDGALVLKGVPFSDRISQKVFDMIDEGHPADGLVNFLRKVRQNPSAASQRELLLFCEANGFMIHEDGDIIAYKGVRDNGFDSYSGSVLNLPWNIMTEEQRNRYSIPQTSDGVTVQATQQGTIVTMPRGQVNDDRNETCSFGLHFAAHEYASGFGQRLMVMKINPADVVSIPSDYNNQKGRCCRYVIISELENKKALPHREIYDDGDLMDPDWPDEGDEYDEEYYDEESEDTDEYDTPEDGDPNEFCWDCGSVVQSVFSFCPVCGVAQ